MNHTRLSPLFLTPLLLLSACVANPPRPAEPEAAAAPAAPAVEPPAPVATAITPEQLYRLLVAELAGQREEYGLAVGNYLEAAREAEDPELAKRATRIAFYAKDDVRSLEAARRWVELAPDDPAAHKTVAVLSLRNGLLDEAQSHFEQLFRLQPDHSPFALVGQLLGEEENRETVLVLIERLQANRPDDPEGALIHARLALAAGQAERALAQAERALALKPGWQEARVLHAQILVAMERIEPALADLAAAVAEQPAERELRLAYARLLIKARRLEQAKKQFDILARQAPKDPEVLYALSLLALEAEELEEAKGFLERLLQTGKRPSESHYYLGLIAEQQHLTGDALRHFEQVEGGEYHSNALLKRVGLLAEADRLDEARALLERLRGENPKAAIRLYLAEGDLLRQAGLTEEALLLFDQALERFPGDLELLYGRAMAAEALGRLEEMERDLRTVLEAEPDNAQALNALGYTLADRTDRAKEALELVRRAFELLSDDPAVMDSMGWVLFRLGRTEEALPHLERAFAAQVDPEIGAHLGEVLWHLGRRDEARRIWEQSRELDPEHPVLKATMERLLDSGGE